MTDILKASLGAGIIIGVGAGMACYERTRNLGRAIVAGLWAGVNTFFGAAIGALLGGSAGIMFTTYFGARALYADFTLVCR